MPSSNRRGYQTLARCAVLGTTLIFVALQYTANQSISPGSENSSKASDSGATHLTPLSPGLRPPLQPPARLPRVVQTHSGRGPSQRVSQTTAMALEHIDRWGSDSSVDALLSQHDRKELLTALNADLATKIEESKLDRETRAITYLLHHIGDSESHSLITELLKFPTPSLSNAEGDSSRVDVVLAKSFAIRALESITSRSPIGERVRRLELALRYVIEFEDSPHVAAIAAMQLLARSPHPSSELHWLLERLTDEAANALFADRKAAHELGEIP